MVVSPFQPALVLRPEHRDHCQVLLVFFGEAPLAIDRRTCPSCCFSFSRFSRSFGIAFPCGLSARRRLRGVASCLSGFSGGFSAGFSSLVFGSPEGLLPALGDAPRRQRSTKNTFGWFE